MDHQPVPKLPSRDPRGHKGTFGTVCVFGGCAGPDRRMIGAPALTALGALRVGAGLVRICCPAPVIDHVIAAAPSATGVPLPVDSEGRLLADAAPQIFDRQLSSSSALVVGPGLGEDPAAAALALRAVQQQEVPVVVDADALNSLAAVPELWRDFHAAAILTPHPGEYRRLAESLRIALDPTDESARPDAAEALAQRLGCVVVLKGAGTVVSDGQRTWICRRGHPCLGTAGTGDVLCGVIAGLVAQRPRGVAPDLYNLARLGVCAHAAAGERWARARGAQAGLLASELADELPQAIEEFRG